jgi:hypothetical protein
LTPTTPSGLRNVDDAIAGAYRDAPPGVIDRVRKGFQAVMVRDWKVADAWFRDALYLDPTNVGLQRLIDAVGPSEAERAKAIKELEAEIDRDMLHDLLDRR